MLNGSTSKHLSKEGEQLALDVYIKLSRAAEAVSSRVNSRLSALGLSISQFGVLEALYHLGALSQKELASKILKSSGNLTLVIDNLVKRGLVSRERNDSDRRKLHICLTAEGHKLIADYFPSHAQGVVEAVSALSQQEQQQLAQLCKKLGLSLS